MIFTLQLIMEFEPIIKQYIALMKLGVFPKEKIVNNKRKPILSEEWKPTRDTSTQILWYGGAAGWGKSVLISYWLKVMCERYPWTRWFLARDELKRLKTSTILTFFELLQKDWYVKDWTWKKWYRYYEVRWWIEFNNWSVIDLIELWYQPSDPIYARIGSTEYTGGAIDEAAEINYDWFDIISSRIRYKLENFCHNCHKWIDKSNFVREEKFDNPEFGTDPEVIYTEDMRQFSRNVYKCPHCWEETYWLQPRMICSFNPDKGWVYHKFYSKYREGTLPHSYAFIPALPWDNPNLAKSYIQRLYNMSEINKQRLLYGNFEYDDSPWRIFDYDQILDWFNRETEDDKIEWERKENTMLDRMISDKWYLPEFWYNYKMVVDPARAGKDLAMLVIFNGLSVEKIIIYGTSSITDLEDKCKQLMSKYNMTRHDVIVDEWWVWWGLKDALRCKWFIAHSSPIQPKPNKKVKDKLDKVSYHRLRDQCYHLLSQKQKDIAISLKHVKIYNSSLTVEQLKRRIIDDVDAVVQIDIDKDWPYKVMSKKDLKKKLGRSPDFGDALMMYMLFFIKKPRRVFARW